MPTRVHCVIGRRLLVATQSDGLSIFQIEHVLADNPHAGRLARLTHPGYGEKQGG